MRSRIVILAAVMVLVFSAAALLRRDEASSNSNSSANVEFAQPSGATSSGVGVSSASGGTTLPSLTAIDAAAAKASALPAGMGPFAPGQEKAYLQAPSLTKEELRSVERLAQVFFRWGRGRGALNKLVEQLERDGLKPVIAKDANPYTGKMLTIRTAETLPGTKNFHAQYFEDEGQNKEPFPQHRSFEVRGSSDCMAKTRAILEKTFGRELGEPVRVRGDDWVEWKKGDESIWIHRIGLEELRYDPVNARTLADLGNCKAAIELIPEDDSEHLPAP